MISELGYSGILELIGWDPCFLIPQSLKSPINLDDFVKNHFPDGVVKGPRSRLANPENTAIAGAEGSVLVILRSDEG